MTEESTGRKPFRFIINTTTAWDEAPRARHQVTFALAKKFRIAFVASNKFGVPKIEFINYNDNLVVIQPYFPCDCRVRYRIPILNEIYQLWFFMKLKKKFYGVDIINFDFTAYLIHSYFKQVYYYCNDNFYSISKKLNIWPIAKYHSFCENRVAKKAILCVGTSTIITANLMKMNIKSFAIPLGGPDIKEFDIHPSKKINKKGSIIIGLVGFIRNYNLSCQLINDILSQIDCNITLIGPVEPEFYNKIDDKKRINLKGILKDKELLKEVNKFDIAIAPYVDNKINEGGIPNKLYVYLALGKPVVVTELLSLTQMNLPKELLYLVKDVKNFPNIIKKAYYENTNDLIQLRTDYARLNTWDIRMEKFIKLL